jgi:opacity protein-like surface antigen
MQMRRRFAVATLGLFAALGAPGLVCAQATPPESAEVRRPYRGLFGGEPGLVRGQSLTLSASIYGAYDDNVYADQFAVAPTADLRESGWYQGAQASLAYAKRGRRVGFGASGGVGVTRYPNHPAVAVYTLGASISGPLARRTSLAVSESFVYSPEFRLSLFADPNQPGGFQDPFATVTPDLGVFGDSSYRTSTNVSVTHSLRTGSIDAYYSLITANYQSGTSNYTGQGAGVRYGRSLTRNASLRLGYGYGTGGYSAVSDENSHGVHNIDAGIDYGRALSVSRRTRVSFSTGSALFYADTSTDGRLGSRLQYALIGSATLVHELGRTWTASAVYRRSVDFHEGFADPFLSQSVSADLQGMLARRLRFTSAVAYSRGLIGARSSDTFATTSVTAGLEYGISRRLAAFVNYVYYQYEFATQAAVDPRFPDRLNRDGVRMGLSTSIPLIRGRR